MAGTHRVAPRIIPCLDVRDGQVVKGVQFRNHRVMGDIIELARRYRDWGADELVFYDITASPEGRRVDVDWVRRVSETIDIPFCVAGGIRSVEDAAQVLLNADGMGGTPEWVKLLPGGALFPGRYGAQSWYDGASDRLFVAGGNGQAGITSDVWVLFGAGGSGTPMWVCCGKGRRTSTRSMS